MNKETRARQLAPIVGRDLRLFRARNPQSFPRTAFIAKPLPKQEDSPVAPKGMKYAINGELEPIAKPLPKQEDSPVAPDGMVYMPNGELRPIAKPLSEYSDEELEDELLKRRQLASLKEFMSTNGITEDRLLKILGV